MSGLAEHLEDLLCRVGYDADLATLHALALVEAVEGEEPVQFAILQPFSDAAPVFSSAVNSYRVRSELGLAFVLDLLALKRMFDPEA